MAEKISILEQRRIEGAIVKDIFAEIVQSSGQEAARDIIARAVRRSARNAGRQLAGRMGGGDLTKFLAILPLWQQDEALKIQFEIQSPRELTYRVTDCAYARMYREMGLAHLGFLLSCSRDGAFMEGFAPQAELTRTQTIMEGGSYCDFCYRLKTETV
ncbi:MAG: L-2-amino-thiazoline-4-carboxylic acid hydrolase [Deltaproteobacteria bacterium]|nr:L-2-amino-thiazoline-4-carboxylic acid hydrolase [Deltaproteobacteria bacterium]